VMYTLAWKCPPIGLSVGGDFVAKSGGLLSKGSRITIKNVFPTPTPVPAIPAIPGIPTTPTTPVTPEAPPAALKTN
jgi:hypothetical protein